MPDLSNYQLNLPLYAERASNYRERITRNFSASGGPRFEFIADNKDLLLLRFSFSSSFPLSSLLLPLSISVSLSLSRIRRSASLPPRDNIPPCSRAIIPSSFPFFAPLFLILFFSSFLVTDAAT